jgi:hypothetical protein
LEQIIGKPIAVEVKPNGATGRATWTVTPLGLRRASREKSESIHRKCGDSLRELEETGYWLELLSEAGMGAGDELQKLRTECDELTAIFVTILKRSKESLS